MSGINLKQCPFCGGKAEFKEYETGIYVECTECSGQTLRRGASFEQAAADWNAADELML